MEIRRDSVAGAAGRPDPRPRRRGLRRVALLALFALGCSGDPPAGVGDPGTASERWRLDAAERLASAREAGDAELARFWEATLERRARAAAGAPAGAAEHERAAALEREARALLEGSTVLIGYESHDQEALRRASARLEEALELDPAGGGAERSHLAGYARFLTDDHERARAHLEEALARDPEAFASWQVLGTLLLNEGDARAALAPLERAAALAPEDANARYVLGKCLEELARPAAAEEAYRAALALHPGLIEPYHRLAAVLAAEGREDGARRLLSWFLWWKEHKVALRGVAPAGARGTPELEALHALLAERLARGETGAEEEGAARTALADAELLLALGRDEQAAARLREARRGARSAELLAEVAAGWLALEDGERAAALLARALELDPAHVEARLAFARLCERAGKAQAAREHWRAALARSPRCGPALRALAEQER